MTARNSTALLALLLAGCAVRSPYNRSYVSEGIAQRTDYELGEVAEPGELNLPGEVSLADGLTQEEAIAIALWNNAQFQVDLTELGFARADLIEAKFFSNPIFSLLFPVGPKGREAKLNFPVGELWQRPFRVAAARLDAERISENLIQHGLGLVRDVQTAYAELLFARQRSALAEEEVQLCSQIAEISRARLLAGDISELEASAALVDSLRAEDSTARFSHDATVSRYRLNTLLGLDSGAAPFALHSPAFAPQLEVSTDELLDIAFAARPDLRASELAIEAAGRRLGWERSQIFDLIGIIDAKDKGEEHLTTGPGFQLQIPLLNQNQGGIARAKAELEQAARDYVAVRHRIALEVQEACADYALAQAGFELWHERIIPSLEGAADRAQRAYVAGEESYLFVLVSRQQLLYARIRRAELAADLSRASAQLNYSVGKKMIPTGQRATADGSEF